jgi:hypothetical protein
MQPHFIDDLYEQIVFTLKVCSNAFLRNVKHNFKVKWSPYLKHLKVLSRQAMLDWMENGCPISGVCWENYISCKRVLIRVLLEIAKK